ncbi:MAG: molybdenum cofactor biosynthesis protein MoaE [Acidiferrobacterales bacterium]
MHIELRDTSFNPWDELQQYQCGLGDMYGATVSFIGTMRDFNEGETVQLMKLEHYPGMTEKHLREIGEQAHARWDIVDGLVIHRVGVLRPGDPIVLIVVWSVHRAAAFAACRYLIEELKSRAPFWKKETLDDEARWVEHNTPAA